MRPSVPMTIGHLVDGGGIEGGGQTDGLGKLGGAVAATPCSASLHQS